MLPFLSFIYLFFVGMLVILFSLLYVSLELKWAECQLKLREKVWKTWKPVVLLMPLHGVIWNLNYEPHFYMSSISQSPPSDSKEVSEDYQPNLISADRLVYTWPTPLSAFLIWWRVSHLRCFMKSKWRQSSIWPWLGDALPSRWKIRWR